MRLISKIAEGESYYHAFIGYKHLPGGQTEDGKRPGMTRLVFNFWFFVWRVDFLGFRPKLTYFLSLRRLANLRRRVKIVRQPIKDIGISVSRSYKVAFIGCYWFGIQISYGSKLMDLVGVYEMLDKEFKRQASNKCLVCQKPLRPGFGSIAMYHKECRKLRHKKHVQTS